jgi:hypothetical protein
MMYSTIITAVKIYNTLFDKAQEIWGGFDVSGTQQLGIYTFVNSLRKYITKEREREKMRERHRLD